MKPSIKLLFSVFLYMMFLGTVIICSAQELKPEDARHIRLESEVSLFIRNFKYKDAIVKLDSLINLNFGDRQKNLLLKAQCYKKLYMFPQSIDLLIGISAADTANVQILSELADCWLLSGGYSECAQVYDKMLQTDSTNTYFEMQKALVNVKGDYWANALIGFNNLYRRGDSTNHVILRLMGDCYYNTGNGNASLFFYNKAIQAKPTDQLAVRKLATIYLNLVQAPMAVVVTNNYIKYDSTNIEVNRLNGIAKYVSKDFEGAIKVLDTLVAKGDDSYSTNYYLGLSKSAINHFYEAIRPFTVAYEYDTTNVDVVYYLGTAYCNSISREKKGIELLNQGLKEMQPKVENLVKYNISLANGYSGLRNYPKAIECMEKVYKLNSKNTQSLYHIATYYEYSKNLIKATEYYREYINKTPNKPMRSAASVRFKRLQEQLFMEGIEIEPLAEIIENKKSVETKKQ